MIPGTVGRVSDNVLASATTIVPKSEIVRITGSTTIQTILPPLGIGFSQILILIPVDGAVTLGTSGNILVGIAAAQNRAVYLIWSKFTQKWYINSGV